jgi:abortive infection bacteriophage resistance protein
MALKPYTKPALTCAQQVALLEQRGMVISHRAAAEFYLGHLNYYRLAGYCLPFEVDHATHQLRPGTTFEQVMDLYVFDRELRLLALDAIERVEVSVRTRWAHTLGSTHSAHAHLNARLADDPVAWATNVSSLAKEVERSHDIFIKHFRSTYQERLPPIWATCEVMSLGSLSRWYAQLRPMATRKKIAVAYHLDEAVLESFLHALTLIRNVCAHHGRLWNRELRVRPKSPKRPLHLARSWSTTGDRVHNSLLVLAYFLDVISPRHTWRQRLIALIDKHQPDLAAMGFPANWRTQPLWNVAT